MFPNFFPFSNFHELNLDWILETLKGLKTQEQTVKEETDTLFNEYFDKYLKYTPNKNPENFFMMAEDFGVIGDGVTDNADALEAAMIYCLNHNVGLGFKAGTYIVGRDIVVDDRKSGHEDFSLIMQGCGQGTIIKGGSITLAGNSHYIVSNMQFKFDGEKGLILGTGSNYANRSLFVNCLIEGNPSALTLVFCNAVRFIGCRISSRAEYIPLPSAVYPVCEFANLSTYSGTVNSIAFIACHFEGTKSGGVFIYKPSGTKAAYGIAFYGCHFETRNYASKIFDIVSGNVWTFDACVMTNNSYSGGGVTDGNEQAVNRADGVVNLSILHTLFDLKRTGNPPIANIHSCSFCTINGRYPDAVGDYVNYSGAGADTLEIEVYSNSSKYTVQKRANTVVG